MTDEKDDKWKMPDPVFRSTTGDLPKTLQKTISGYNMPKDVADLDDDAEDDILSVMDHPIEARAETGAAAGGAANGELELEPDLLAESPVKAEPKPDLVPEPEPEIAVEEAWEPPTPPEVRSPIVPKIESATVPEQAPPEVQEAPPIKIAAAAQKPEKKSGAGSFVLIFLLIAALAAGLVWAIMYFLAQRTGAGT